MDDCTSSGQASKRLKVAPPDLIVLIGEKEKPFQHYSMIMASHSAYIDDLLANGMKESSTWTIRFPDIDEKTWLLMMVPLEDPAKANSLSPQEAVCVVSFYDKYGFQGGISLLCAGVFKAYIEDKDPKHFELSGSGSGSGSGLLFPKVPRLYGSICRYALDFESGSTYDQFVKHIEQGLACQYSWKVFTREYLEEIAPFVAREKTLLQLSFSNKEGVLSPIWPDYFWLRKARNVNFANRNCCSSLPDWFHVSH